MTEQDTFDKLSRSHISTVADEIWDHYKHIISTCPNNQIISFPEYTDTKTPPDEHATTYKRERDAILAKHHWTLADFLRNL